MRDLNSVRLGVIGLGYVGLPLAVEFGKRFPVTGFDVNAARVAELLAGRDSSLEVDPDELRAATQLRCTAVEAELTDCNVYIVTVPTPIDEFKSPDLRPVESATTKFWSGMPTSGARARASSSSIPKSVTTTPCSPKAGSRFPPAWADTIDSSNVAISSRTVRSSVLISLIFIPPSLSALENVLLSSSNTRMNSMNDNKNFPFQARTLKTFYRPGCTG